MRAEPKALRAHLVVAFLVLAAASAALPPAASAGEEPEFTSQFFLHRCNWSSVGGQNLFFKLQPGWQLVLEGEEEDESELVDVRVEITVLSETKWITFQIPGGPKRSVQARVVLEREWVDDELVEVSRNWFARCTQTSDIFYFGEFVNNYEDGEISDHEGSWQAGKNGALPGIIMPGRFLLGARYFQELAPGVALDRGENVDMGITITTEAGTFKGCVEVQDTNALEPSEDPDQKIYCPNIGLVKDEEAELVEYGYI
ncbi:MAG TPA: hypothetical protein VI942_03200 [Thermoanaerobaculia bacterium]|nr:hypothetical protein [Thermoanaerobaculia bacterium]